MVELGFIHAKPAVVIAVFVFDITRRKFNSLTEKCEFGRIIDAVLCV
jgi:hypothetical protein